MQYWNVYKTLTMAIHSAIACLLVCMEKSSAHVNYTAKKHLKSVGPPLRALEDHLVSLNAKISCALWFITLLLDSIKIV